MYDVIVVGARCAGSPLAMLLARQGHRVLLLDRAEFPSDKPVSTHAIVRPGGAALGRWGLLDGLTKLGAPAMHEYRVDFGPVVLTSDSPDDGDATALYAPRRTLLDKYLVDAAVAAGAELREGFSVRELIRDGDRVVGVRGGDRGGAVVEERAKIVVGADGLSSIVARETGAARYHDVATHSGCWWGYFRGVPIERVHIWFRPRRMFVAIRTDDDLTLAMNFIAIDDFHEFTADVDRNFMNDYRQTSPEFFELLEAGEREGRWMGTGYQPNYFRESAGPGWALVGDAGSHHDSVAPTGISNAFTEAEMLSEAIHTGLAGDKPLDEATRAYQARRDARWYDHWAFIVDLARLQPPPAEFVALIQALVDQPEATRRFMGFFEGQEAHRDFMSPDNLAKVVGGAG